MTRFLNMKLNSPENQVGNIDGPFGKSGKVKVSFDDPSKIKKNMKLTMNFKKYIFDENKKKMYQDWMYDLGRMILYIYEVQMCVECVARK